MTEEDFIKIANINTQVTKINVEAIVLNKSERLVNTKDGRQLRVADCLIEDDTAQIYLTLWESDIQKIKIGNIIKIKNGYVTTFKNTKKLQVGKYGTLEVVNP